MKLDLRRAVAVLGGVTCLGLAAKVPPTAVVPV